jgi:hypothetical protein
MSAVLMVTKFMLSYLDHVYALMTLVPTSPLSYLTWPSMSCSLMCSCYHTTNIGFTREKTLWELFAYTPSHDYVSVVITFDQTPVGAHRRISPLDISWPY